MGNSWEDNQRAGVQHWPPAPEKPSVLSLIEYTLDEQITTWTTLLMAICTRPHLPDAGKGWPEVAVSARAASDPLWKLLQRASAGVAPVTQHYTGVIAPVTNRPAWGSDRKWGRSCNTGKCSHPYRFNGESVYARVLQRGSSRHLMSHTFTFKPDTETW